MDPLTLGLTLLGIALTIGIAWWQFCLARQAESKLNNTLQAMPSLIAQQVMLVFNATQPNPSKSDETLPSTMTSYADVDGDGEKELLVSYIVGPYSSALKIFKWQTVDFTSEFTVIGEIVPILGFEVNDFDFDGKEEIMTFQDDPDTGLPHAAGLYVNVLYKWKEGRFTEISRHKDYTLENLEERRKDFHSMG
jgi:hypothetical protein